MIKVTPSTKIKPCPFCGGVEIHFHKHEPEEVYSMCCHKCGATFPNMYRLGSLVIKWNRRE
jgi:Lar family restriction alleviation protein